MRTLKKVLALSLVFAMAFTMMAGAAFKDQDKIDSALTNDIQLLTALGVFKGDENGNFNPTDNVKRSEAAKMIYVLKNNGVDDGAVAFQGVSKYSDVPVGHWAEGYINYCTNLGYMGGWQENGVQKFDPNGNVTGVELMKMLLCMIGYKADVQGYTGNGWQTNVLVDAATSGLSANFIPSVYGATPRQWTARLMTNAIDANWVTYSKGELTYAKNTYGEQFLKLVTVEGTLTETNHNKLATANNAEGSMSAVLNDVDYVVVTDSDRQPHSAIGDADPALLGQPVKMYYKDGGNLGENKLYAVLPYSKTQVIINTTVDAVTVKSNGDVTVEGMSAKYTAAANGFSVYAGNVLVRDNVAAANIGNYLGNNVNDQVTLIVNKSTGEITSIKLHTLMAFAEVNKLDANKGVFSLTAVSTWMNGKNLVDEADNDLVFSNANKENFNKYLNVASDVKEGSIVKIVADISSGKPVYNVTLADKVEGKVEGYTVDGNNYDTLKVNGTNYKRAEGSNEIYDYDWATADSGVASHDTFYTDGKYVVYSTASEEVAPAVTNLAYLISGGRETSNLTASLKVKVLLADGTQGVYTLNEKVGIGQEIAEAVKGQLSEDDKNSTAATQIENKAEAIYTYSISDGVITLKNITPDDLDENGKLTYVEAADAITYKPSTGIAKVEGVDTEYKTNAETFFFVKSGTKYSVVKASELKQEIVASGAQAGQVENSKNNSVFAAQKVNGFATMLAGVMELDTVPTAKALDYYFVTGKASYVGKVDDKYVVELPVNAAGEESKLTFKYDDDTAVADQMVELNKLNGKLVEVSAMNSDGSIADEGDVSVITKENSATANKWTAGRLAAWDGTNAVIGDKLVKVASDVKIFNVDVNATAQKAAVLVEGDSAVKSDGADSVLYLMDAAGEKIVAIFCEVDGEAITGTYGIVD